MEGATTVLVAITVVLAALAVLAAIVVVAVGGGGELSTEHPDHPPLALPGRRAVGGTDAALLRLPLGLWGYHKQITDEALGRFAYELTERDTRIAILEQQLAEARQGYEAAARGRALPAARPPAPPVARSDTPGGGDTLATRADHAFGTPPSGGDPLVTRTDRPSATPATREEPLPSTAEQPPGASAERGAGAETGEITETGEDVEDTPPARADGGE